MSLNFQEFPRFQVLVKELFLDWQRCVSFSFITSLSPPTDPTITPCFFITPCRPVVPCLTLQQVPYCPLHYPLPLLPCHPTIDRYPFCIIQSYYQFKTKILWRNSRTKGTVICKRIRNFSFWWIENWIDSLCCPKPSSLCLVDSQVDDFLYPHYLSAWHSIDTVRRNKM